MFESLFSEPTVLEITPAILLLIIWTLVWKGIALWKSAQNAAKWWFVAMLILNTAGILPILYIYIFSKKNEKRSEEATHDE